MKNIETSFSSMGRRSVQRARLSLVFASHRFSNFLLAMILFPVLYFDLRKFPRVILCSGFSSFFRRRSYIRFKDCRHTRSLLVLQFFIIVLAVSGCNEAKYSRAMVNFQNIMLTIPSFIHILSLFFFLGNAAPQTGIYSKH